MPIGDWEGTDSDLARYLLDSNERSLQSYQSKPEWIEEHARIEQGIAEGGYGHRQVYELVQNGADAMVHRSGGRIEVILTDTHLYCANEGDPIDRPGLEALLASNMSRKRGDEIGRFGLGFKSVLAVTDTPEFFSKPVTLRFSREFSEAQIISRIPAARGIPLPILRLGQPLDVATEAQSDPVLAELIDWSATVVRLRREPARDTSWLTTDLTDFPAEFLLFTRHVSRLVLDDRTSGLTRTITVQRGGDEVRLVEGQRDQRWQVFQKVVEPTREARIDGGVRAERDRLPIDWAVPTSGPSAIGKFWAFFPTTFETTLSGILNAPWKTNPDRENLLVGAFNEFLIDAATELVVDKLQQVTSMDDPGRHLDRMPARGREARTWADRRITAGVYELAAQRASLPDQRGQLTFPKDLRLHPERIPTEALELWCSFPFRPHQWVHPSVETRDRRPRVERLLETARRDGDDESVAIANYREWLEALAAPGSAEASAAALAVARLLQAHLSPVDFNEVKQAHIVLSAPGQLVAADPSRVFIGGHPDVAGTVAVHPGLLKDTFAEQTLRDTFGIVDVDRFAEFAAYVATAVDDNAYWDGLWERAELLPADEAADVILRYHRSGDVQIRTIAGSFRPMHSVLLTGPVVHADADADHTIDEGWHSTTLALLKALGATDVPRPDREGFADPPPWFSDYLDAVRIAFKAEGQTVRANTAVESDHTGIPTHIEMLASLSEEARARLTAELIRLPTTRQSWSWRAGGGHQHPSLEFPSPAAWMVKHHGTLLTTQGPRPVPTAVSASLTAFGRLLPVSRLSAEVTSILELPENVGDTPTAVLNEAMGLLADETDDDLIGRFISAVADLLAAPESLRCRVGRAHRNCPPTEVTAMVSSELTPSFERSTRPSWWCLMKMTSNDSPSAGAFAEPAIWSPRRSDSSSAPRKSR
ncbi:sacsin N-terminal ATP-binding-like domain-containing protein [Mycolicibacterium psychrotolerans]|uniref:sacsin N-terminal ATP-binding-like domain-containing protein n=1 Tax=Mycolicibacterium psychrotolerans TaxID=216929 RepID=UPI003D66F8A9